MSARVGLLCAAFLFIVCRYQKDPAAAVTAITKFGVEVGDQLTKDWLQFWMFLFATTRDGFTTTPSTAKLCDVNGPVDKLKGALL